MLATRCCDAFQAARSLRYPGDMSGKQKRVIYTRYFVYKQKHQAGKRKQKKNSYNSLPGFFVGWVLCVAYQSSPFFPVVFGHGVLIACCLPVVTLRKATWRDRHSIVSSPKTSYMGKDPMIPRDNLSDSILCWYNIIVYPVLCFLLEMMWM